MKVKLFSILCIAFLVFSCGNDDEVITITPEQQQFVLLQNSSILVGAYDDITFTEFVAGDKLVFLYRYTAPEDPDIADDEYGESILFEINSNLETFSFNDTQLLAVNTFFETSCFCENEGSIAIQSGTIEGTKINDANWNISIAINFTLYGEPQSRTVSGIFSLANN